MMFTRGSNDEPTAELPHEALHATRGAHDAAPHDRQHDQLHAVPWMNWMRFTYKLYVYNLEYGNMYDCVCISLARIVYIYTVEV